MAIKSPGKILILWNKNAKKHEEGKKPAELPKKGELQKTKIKKGLTNLKLKAKNDLTKPANGVQFTAARDQTATVMRNYCRYLKSAKDEDKKLLPKFLKMVKQLTALVMALNVADLDQSEDDVSLESLGDMDVSALDKALDSGAEPEVELEAEVQAEEAQPPAPSAPPPPAPPPVPPPASTARVADPAERWKKRWGKVSPAIVPVLKAKPPNAARLQQAAGDALKLSQAGNYADALTKLALLEQLLAEALRSGTAIPAGPSDAALARWQAVRGETVTQLRGLASKFAAARDPEAKEAVLLLNAVMKNLTAAPKSPQQITALEKFILQDDVLADVGLAFDVQTPLLQALAGLKS